MSGRVAAVVVNYNRAQDTIRCVASLRSLVEPVEPIVVDNASTDDSASVIRSALPDVMLVVCESNRGYGAGANAGFRRALELGADYVLTLNNDTELVNPTFVMELRRALDTTKAAGIAGPRVRYGDGTVQPTIVRLPSFRSAVRLAVDRRVGRTVSVPSERRFVDAVNGVCFLIRRETLEDVGGFDERYFMYVEEADLCARAAQAGWRTIFVPVESVIHHHERGELRGDSAILIRRNYIRFCATHRGRLSAAATTLCFLAAALARDARRRRAVESRALVGSLRR